MLQSHCLTSPHRPFAINRGQERDGSGLRATANLSPHGISHRRWLVFNSLLSRAALLFTHVALTLLLSFYRYSFGRRASLWLQPRRKAYRRPPSARKAARGTCKHSLLTSPCPRLPQHAPTPGRLRSKINHRICSPLYPHFGLPPMRRLVRMHPCALSHRCTPTCEQNC